MKNPKTTYNNKKIATEIRRYMFEHIQFLDKVFTNIEQAEITIAETKSQFCMSGLKVVGYICNIKKGTQMWPK